MTLPMSGPSSSDERTEERHDATLELIRTINTSLQAHLQTIERNWTDRLEMAESNLTDNLNEIKIQISDQSRKTETRRESCSNRIQATEVTIETWRARGRVLFRIVAYLAAAIATIATALAIENLKPNAPPMVIERKANP